MTPVLNARGLRIEGRLRPTDLTIGTGELVALIGANGSAKTSLLRCIADVEGEADALDVGGESVKVAPPSRRPRLLTFLPASRDIAWPISVSDLLALGMIAPNPARLSELLELFELEDFADRPVKSLSTGERSRVLLARALAPRPRLLLLDEPMSNLDPYWALHIMDVLRQEVGGERAALVALHDLNQLESFDRVILMDGGRPVFDAAPSEMLESDHIRESFGVERRSGRWSISRRAADRQSSQ